MATTKIHDIGTDSAKCIYYAKNDKVDELKDGISDSINYVINDKTGKVVYKTLSSYLNCNEDTVINDFKKCAEEGRGSKRRESSRRKDGQEVVSFHLHQNFEGYEVDPVTANEIGRKLAEEILKGYPCVISTHTNTKNIHNHIVFCAWNEDGSKYNDCHSTYRAIRRVSDRLCKEYGLSILMKTQEMKLIKYKGANGKVRYYEPTERKNNLITERESGGVGDYRNSPAFDVYNERKENNRDIVKSDIDVFIPSVRSYDELLDRLRDIGYIINGKKKNGEWLKHISFKPPIADKPTRDYNIGVDDEKDFYKRENLTKYIEDRAKEIAFKQNTPSVSIEGLKYFENYEYENINDIDDNFRILKSNDGRFIRESRSPAEKENIITIRSFDRDLREGFDPLKLIKYIDEIKEKKRKAKISGQKYIPKSEKDILFEYVQKSLRSLRFVETNKIYSLKQLNDLHSSLKSNYEKNIAEHDKLLNLVSHLKSIIETPEKAAALSAKITANMDDEEYLLENYNDDIFLLGSYRETIAKYRIDTDETKGELQKKIERAENKADEVCKVLNKINKRIGEYENCIEILNRNSSESRETESRKDENTNVKKERTR